MRVRTGRQTLSTEQSTCAAATQTERFAEGRTRRASIGTELATASHQLVERAVWTVLVAVPVVRVAQVPCVALNAAVRAALFAPLWTDVAHARLRVLERLHRALQDARRLVQVRHC